MTNMVKERIEDIDLCKPLRPGNVFFPEPRNFTSMISLCKKMRAKVTVVENENIQNELLEKFNKQNNSTVGNNNLIRKVFMLTEKLKSI